MPIRPTLQMGDPLLKADNRVISSFGDKRFLQAIEDLVDTMRENQLIGMAAPQIGENFRLFVTEPRPSKFRTLDQSDKLRVYINPEITWVSPEKIELYEGCGSVANATVFGPVERPKIIKIEYYDETGNKHWLKCDGILARVIQHEYDHLNGIEFTEKISNYKKLMTVEWYVKLIKPDLTHAKLSQITIKESDL